MVDQFPDLDPVQMLGDIFLANKPIQFRRSDQVNQVIRHTGKRQEIFFFLQN